ncbi:hypothetical protein O6H91_12G059100 [Diphasiastrum complanatum]|uniref:Uncharacterized protein n=2 Tax=Diphasiastrum complanatum TaxID=34168 RepID=A0ACC2C2F0_DIPCM|nr:hypothetical protein O6H91_12G059100 [Diphasiastrum complanatum]KAJ7536179.1 hypothetical protein O6H91_12G059100 [Diphasiastrum complanatum]
MDGKKVLFNLGDEHISAEEVLGFLASIQQMQNLSGALLRKIVKALKMRQFGPGELISDGQAGQEFYIIWKGEVEVRAQRVAVAGGSPALVLKAGDCFGAGLAGVLESHTQVEVLALDEVTCLFLSHEHLSLVSNVSARSSMLTEGVAVVEQILNLENLAVDLFRGFTLPGAPSFGNVYGGQLVAQALAAASQSVNPPLLVHSLHCYFVVGGDITLPIVYRVKRLKDGNSFALRHVDAMQNGQIIFNMNASFQKPWEGLEHQTLRPDAPDPETIPSLILHQGRFFTEDQFFKNMKNEDRERFRVKRPLDVRSCDIVYPHNEKKLDPREKVWIRSKEKLTNDEALHRCVAAYASDWTILDTCFRPHHSKNIRLKGLSLDHSMWFHKPFKADEWLLLVADSPRASTGRGLALGHFYTQSGELVVSVAQEGLIRELEQQKIESRL